MYEKRIVRQVGYLQELLLGIARRSWLSTFREMSAPFFEGQVVRELPFPSRWEVKKVKLTLEQATKAQRGSRGIALLFL